MTLTHSGVSELAQLMEGTPACALIPEIVRPAGLIESLSQGPLSGLSAWVEVGGIAPSLCWKAPPLQPIST
jgi:hypothetical protein